MRNAINSPSYHVPIDGFSQIVEAPAGGRTLYLSGLTARTSTGQIVGPGDMRAQASQVLENMRVILEAAGATLDHVVSIQTFVTDIEAYPEIDEVWREAWGSVWPASTMVEVARLWDERQMVEMEAIAVVPE